MVDIKNMAVTYHCVTCGKPFQVMQGSRQQNCDECISKKVKQGRPKKNSVKSLSLNKSVLSEIAELAKKARQ